MLVLKWFFFYGVNVEFIHFIKPDEMQCEKTCNYTFLVKFLLDYFQLISTLPDYFNNHVNKIYPILSIFK